MPSLSAIRLVRRLQLQRDLGSNLDRIGIDCKDAWVHRHQPDCDSGARQSAAVGAGRREHRQNRENGTSGTMSSRITSLLQLRAAFGFWTQRVHCHAQGFCIR
jgi:hypothetical protein